jgi:chitinase
VGATIADGTGIATVKNDDGIGISIDNVTKYEGAAGTYNTYAFTVSLSMIPSWPVSVTASTFNWTAVAPADYFAKTRVLSFAAGERTKTFVVVLRGDAVREEGEKFFVTLTNPTAGATVLTPYGTGLIRNDDF